MKTSTKIIMVSALSASRRPPRPSRSMFWVVIIFIFLFIGMCSSEPKKEVSLKPYNDADFIKCSTDSECEQMHGHDKYGNPVGRPTYPIPTKDLKRAQ